MKRLLAFGIPMVFVGLTLIFAFQNCGDPRMQQQPTGSTPVDMNVDLIERIQTSTTVGLPNQLKVVFELNESGNAFVEFSPLFENSECRTAVNLTGESVQRLRDALKSVRVGTAPLTDRVCAMAVMDYEVLEFSNGQQMRIEGYSCASKDFVYLDGAQQLRCALKTVLDQADLGECQSIWDQGTTQFGCQTMAP